MGFHQRQGGLPPALEGLAILIRHGLEFGVALNASQFGLLEEHRRLDEQIKYKHHSADEQNEKLHGDFGHGVEQQAEAALGDGASREIALHLRLVAAEVGEKQERAAEQAAPDVVTVVPIEVGGHHVEAAGGARQVDGVAKRDL